MMFDQIRDTLANNGKSGVAYAKVVTLIETAMKEDHDHAAGYMVLKVLAERFIESTGACLSRSNRLKILLTVLWRT